MEKKKQELGFTLIELMIVVAIIGVLAAIAIPKFAQMIERAKEGATKGNLGAIRAATSTYYGKQEGTWPDDISGTGFVGTADSLYIADLPKATATPLGNSSAVTAVTAVPTGSTAAGWAYSSASGQVWCGNASTDTRGTSFTVY